MDVAIVGKGWVGRSMLQLFPNAVVYDPGLGIPTAKEDVNKCVAAFICVPTPCVEKGRLDVSVVEECVGWCECPLIVIRSTVNPGTCDRLAALYEKRIVMQPEYLGETPNHPMINPATRTFMIVGGAPADRKMLLDLYFTVYNANVSVRLTSCLEAEVIKLSENRAIAWKVAQVEELIDACAAAGVDYYAVRDAVYGDDPRFNLWWTADHPDSRGFNSKCIPKDVYAWAAWCESLGYTPKITRAILDKNEEWITNA